MDVISLTLKAIKGINDLMKAWDEVVWNKEQCKRLLERLQALSSPLEKIKTKADPSQRQLVTNIVVTMSVLRNLCKSSATRKASSSG